ncbi:MAG TPA: transcription elongation factor GreA [Candidatus Woesebacteria bacterium]|nr:transcription elongation factor GreA [Candidatus Woesebacteria bacterium]
MTRYTIPFTEEGFKQITQEYEELTAKRPEFVHNLAVARDMGDRSENAAYKEARRKLSSTDSRLRFLKKIVEQAVIKKPTQIEFVEIGSYVTVNNGSQDSTFHIVGEHEADPINKKLSYKSPVGQALLRKKVGESISISIPTGTIWYLIKKISYA